MRTVADIMTTIVFTIRSSAKVQQAIALMQEKQVRSLIVERETAGGAYGIVTEQDIVYQVTAVGKDPTMVMVGEIMQRPCATISPHASLPDVAKVMRDEDIQRMPVIEENVMVGVVSITDIVMKSDVASVDLPKDFARRVEVALRHKRLQWNDKDQTAQESEAIEAVLSEFSTGSS